MCVPYVKCEWIEAAAIAHDIWGGTLKRLLEYICCLPNVYSVLKALLTNHTLNSTGTWCALCCACSYVKVSDEQWLQGLQGKRDGDDFCDIACNNEMSV